MLGFGWESAPPGTLRKLKNRSEAVGKELGNAFGSQDAHVQAYGKHFFKSKHFVWTKC